MNGSSQLSRAHWLALLVPAALLGGAYISELGFGLFPCEMCWWQRWPHFAALALAMVAFVAPPKWLWTALAAGGILTSGLLGGYHAGVEYDWWEGITSCASGPVAMSVDQLESFVTPCDEAAFRFLTISLAGWNFIISTLAAITIFVLLAKRDRSAA